MTETKIKLVAVAAAENAIDLQLAARRIKALAGRLLRLVEDERIDADELRPLLCGIHELAGIGAVVEREADDSSAVACDIDAVALGEALKRQIDTRGAVAVFDGPSQELASWLNSSRNVHGINAYPALRGRVQDKKNRATADTDNAA